MTTETYTQKRLLAMIASVEAREIQSLADEIKEDFLGDLDSGEFMRSATLLFWRNEYTSRMSDIPALYRCLRVYFPDIYLNVILDISIGGKLVVLIDPRRRKEPGDL
jgi:hypothetical protein